MLHPETLTWTGLLARWIEFAKASVAIPEDEEGERWRSSVSSVINLQAVTFALAQLEELAPTLRPHARDRAAVLIHEGAARLASVWRGVPMPESLVEIGADARAALAASAYAGSTELVWLPEGGERTMVVPDVPVDGDAGSLAVMQPGTIVMAGEPVAWWTDRDGAAQRKALPDCVARDANRPRQVYRQMDDEGRLVRDVVTAMTADPQPGLPLLVPILHEGHPIGRFTLDAGSWEARQRAAMSGAVIPVIEVE